MKLTKTQIKRQDFVDNKIQQLIEDLNPSENEIKWNIEYISEIREILRLIYTEKLQICNENSFYPFFNK